MPGWWSQELSNDVPDFWLNYLTSLGRGAAKDVNRVNHDLERYSAELEKMPIDKACHQSDHQNITGNVLFKNKESMMQFLMEWS